VPITTSSLRHLCFFDFPIRTCGLVSCAVALPAAGCPPTLLHWAAYVPVSVPSTLTKQPCVVARAACSVLSESMARQAADCDRRSLLSVLLLVLRFPVARCANCDRQSTTSALLLFESFQSRPVDCFSVPLRCLSRPLFRTDFYMSCLHGQPILFWAKATLDWQPGTPALITTGGFYHLC
jgi:hypothetical protein